MDICKNWRRDRLLLFSRDNHCCLSNHSHARWNIISWFSNLFFKPEVYTDSIPIIGKAKRYKTPKSWEACESLCIDTDCATWYFKVRQKNELRKIIIVLIYSTKKDTKRQCFLQMVEYRTRRGYYSGQNLCRPLSVYLPSNEHKKIVAAWKKIRLMMMIVVYRDKPLNLASIYVWCLYKNLHHLIHSFKIKGGVCGGWSMYKSDSPNPNSPLNLNITSSWRDLGLVWDF